MKYEYVQISRLFTLLKITRTLISRFFSYFRPKPEIERPAWLDDPRGKQGKADQLPQDFPRNPYPYSRGSIQGAAN